MRAWRWRLNISSQLFSDMAWHGGGIEISKTQETIQTRRSTFGQTTGTQRVSGNKSLTAASRQGPLAYRLGREPQELDLRPHPVLSPWWAPEAPQPAGRAGIGSLGLDWDSITSLPRKREASDSIGPPSRAPAAAVSCRQPVTTLRRVHATRPAMLTDHRRAPLPLARRML